MKKQETIHSDCTSGINSCDTRCFVDVACAPSVVANYPLVQATGQLQWQNFSAIQESSSFDFSKSNVLGKRWGTAFLITPNILLTAGHCFTEKTGESGFFTPRDLTGQYAKPEQLARLFQVNMQYAVEYCGLPEYSAEGREDSYAVLRLIEYRSQGLDYAIFQVAGDPGRKYGYVKEFDFEFKQGGGYIVQHPDGAPKKVEPVKHAQRRGGKIEYIANTLGGSSGSALTNLQHAVCGVHIEGGDFANYALHVATILSVSPFMKSLLPSIPRFNFSLNQPAAKEKQKLIANVSAGVSIGAGVTLAGLCLNDCFNTKKRKRAALIGMAAVIMLLVGVTVFCVSNQAEQEELNDAEMRHKRKKFLQAQKFNKKRSQACVRTQQRLQRHDPVQYPQMSPRDLASHHPELGQSIFSSRTTSHTATNKTVWSNSSTGWSICFDKFGLYSTVTNDQGHYVDCDRNVSSNGQGAQFHFRM